MIPDIPAIRRFGALAVLLLAGETHAFVSTLEPVADTYIRSDQATINQGLNALVLVGDTSEGDSALRALLSFDLASLPSDATVRSVSLHLTPQNLDGGSAPGPQTIRLHTLLEDFSERGVTWDERRPGVAWSAPGGAYDHDSPDAPLAEVVANPLGVALGTPLVFQSAALTSRVASRAGSRLDLLLKLAVEDKVRSIFRFGSRSTSASAPRLVVEYDRPLANSAPPANPGSATPIPGHPERPISPRVALTAGGHPVEVRDERFGFDVAMFDLPADGSPTTVEVRLASPFTQYTLKPARHNLAVTRDGEVLRFTLTKPLKLVLQVDALPPLAILATPAETGIPSPSDPNVVYFGPGVITAGIIHPLDGQTIYLAPGALVKGRIEAKNVHGVTVKGRGLLETAEYSTRTNKAYGIVFENSRDILVEGIGVRSYNTWWQTLFLNSRDIVVSHLNLFGVGVNTDGVDIDGVREFIVSDCFIRCEDDGLGWHALDAATNGEAITDRAIARDLVIWNTTAGNGIRIGASMETQLWRNILIERVDILMHAKAGIYSDFSDWAWCEDLVFRDITIERPSDPITFKIARTGYSNSTGFLDERGHFERLVFENVVANGGRITLTGHDAAHRIDQVWFNNCVNAGAPVDSLDDLVLNAHVSNVRFNQPVPPRPATAPGRHEAEAQESVTNKIPQITYADASMSGGKGRMLKASAEGDYVDYTIEAPAAGVFRAALRMKRSPSSGSFRVSVNGVEARKEHDLYASSPDYVTVDIGEVSFMAPGAQSFRLSVSGKDRSSSGYRLDLDYLELVSRP